VDVGAYLTGGYEAFNRGDWDHLERMMVPEFVWNEADEVPGRKLCESRAEFEEYMRGFDRLWESFKFEPMGFQEADDDLVIATVRGHGIGRASGAPVDLVIHHVWQVTDGMVVRMDAFLDEREARDHAGLD
jgi:ketosteroid isomerase-like protein